MQIFKKTIDIIEKMIYNIVTTLVKGQTHDEHNDKRIYFR